MKYMRRTAGCTWTDHKTNAQIAKELKITPILDKLLEYKRSWIQHVNRMPRNRLPRVMKQYCPTGRWKNGRPLKRLLETQEAQLHDKYMIIIIVIRIIIMIIVNTILKTIVVTFTTNTTNKHPCPHRDSNRRSQQLKGRRPRGHRHQLCHFTVVLILTEYG